MKFSEMSTGLAALHVFELLLVLLGLAALVTGHWIPGLAMLGLWLALLPSLIARTRDPE